MSKYSDIKKRVVGQMGSTDNKSGSGYSASGAYYDIKKKIKTQGTKYDIDDEYLDSFYSDAKSFLDDADSDYNNNSYSTAKANNENYKSRWSDLNSRAEYIRSYINSRKNSLDDETYSGMMSYLDQFNNASRQYLSAFRNASNYYSQWKTEDEYNDAVEAQKIREKMLSDDLDAAKKDIDALKAVRDAAEEASNNRRNVTYNDLVSAYTRAGYGINAKAKAKADYEAIQANNSKVDSEIASILEGTGYSTIDELNDAITKKSTYYNQAKRLQDSAALYDKAKSASDFDQYASAGDALSNEKIDGFFATEYDKKNKIGYLRNNPEAMDAFDKGAIRAGNDPLNYPVYKAAKYMTNDEYKVYSSYLGRGDTETAEKYLSYLDDELNQRASKEAYKLVKGNTLSELIFGVEAGLDQFKSGIKNLFNTNDEYIAPSYIQYASGMVREDLADAGFNIFGSSLGQIGYDLITTTSNMMPSILTSALVGMANPIAGKVVGAGLMGASAAGNAYQEMLNLGYDKGQARTYSTLTGLSEAGLQSILGGIGKLGGVVSGKSIESIAKGINKAAARFAIQFGGEMASEGLEEFLQDILDPLFKSYATKEFLEIPEGYLEQAVYSGMLGALSAGVLNGFDRATNRVMEYGAAKQIKDEGKVNELVKVGKLFSADTVAYKLADKVTDNTGAWKLSKLLHEVNANLSEQNQADIKYNLVRSGMREADADTVTEWLAKAVDGGKFTSLQQKALDENPIISRVFKKVIIDKNSTVNQRIQGMMNINGVEGQSGIDYAAIAKSQSKENLNKSANYNMAVKQAIAEKNKRDLGIGRTTAFDAEMDRKASEFATEFAKSNNSLSDNSAVKAVKQDVSEKVSDTNKTTVVSTGEEVSIKKIKSISNGNMELELTNGNTVNSKDIKYKSQDEALVYESVLSMGYSADTANAIVNGYNALTGVSASNYLLGVNEAYNYGRIGYPQESIKSEGFYADLTDAQKRFAYNLGKEAAEAETKSAQNAIKKGSNNKTGKVHMTSSISSMTQRQKASVSAIGRVVADATHNDVYIYESVDKDGKRVFSKDIAGHKAGEKAPNGFYDPNTGAIFIDINAGNGGEGVMLWTAAHELTHFIRQWSPEKFKVLADFLMEEYGKNGVDIQTLIQDQINKAKRSGRKLSFDGAYEEVVADAMQTMFTDTNLSEKIAKLKAKDETLWQKIKSFFADLYKRITEAYKGLDPQTDEAKFVRSMKDSIEKLSDMFAEAIVDAGESFSTADAGQDYSTVGGEIDLDGDINVHKLSDRTMIEGAGLQFIPDEDGTHYTVLDASGNPVKEVTPEEISNSPIGQLVASAKDNGFLGKGKEADIAANKQYKFLAELVNMCINYDGLAPIWETAGTMVFSSIKSNADKQYGLTIDFSTVCKKTQAIVDAMSEAMVRLGRGLTRSEVETIYLEVGKAGESTPCPVCYVFSRWMGIGGILDQMSRFQDKYTHMSEGELQSFIAGIRKRISERANTPNKKGNLNGAFFDKNGAIKEGQVIADLKQKANSRAGSTLNAITKNSDIQLQIQELKALMDNQDAKEAKKTDNKIKKLESKLVDVTALEKQFKECNGAVEEYEAYQWLTRTLMEEVDGKWVKNKQFKPVPKDVLFDLNKGAEFAEKYPLSWAFRTGKGASAGKAITPYADARVGEAIQGIASQDVKNIKTGIDLNPFLNGDEKTRQKIIASAIEKQARQNLIGGQRYQSTSDFRYEYGSDYLITFLEMQAIGAKVQLYTKVIEAVDFLASVGADINLSVMPLSDGYVTLPNGKKKLIYSSVTGIDAEAAIKKAHEYNNVQLILVGISDEHIRLALEGDDVTFVIPFHGSGNTVHQIQVLMNLLGENLDVTTAQDYTSVQSDHVSPKQTKEQKAMWDLRVKILTGKASTLSASEFSMLDKNAYLKDLYNRFYVDENADEFGINLSKDVAEQIFPYEYWDKSLTYSEADKNGERFKEYCASMGIIPRFSGMNSKGENVGFGDFTNNKGYWKLLIDRPMYDNTYDSNGNWTGYGKYHEQKRINCSNFQVKHLDPEYGSATYGEVMSKANDPKKTNMIVDRAIAQFEKSNRDENGTRGASLSPSVKSQSEKLSDRDSEYLELAKNPKKNEKRLREMVDNAAIEAGALIGIDKKPILLHHGTNADFYTFDGNKTYPGTFGYGHYFATDKSTAESYGRREIKSYLITNKIVSRYTHNITPENIERFLEEYGINSSELYGYYTDSLDEWVEKHNDLEIIKEAQKLAMRYETGKSTSDLLYDTINILGVDASEVHLGSHSYYVVYNNSVIKSADPVTYDDNGIIPLSERFNTKNDDIRYSGRDSEYLELAKNPKKNEKRLRELVDEAAKEAGYNSPLLYHGTKGFGFTKLKTTGVEAGVEWSPFFAANREDISASYVLYGKKREISSEIGYDEIDEIIEERKEKITDLIYDFRRLIDRHFSEWVFGQGDNSYLENLVENANPEPGYGDGVYDVLSDIVYESFYDYKDNFAEYEDADDWAESSQEGKEIFAKIEEIEGEKSAIADIEQGKELGGIYELYANLDNVFVVDAKGHAWNDLHPEGLPKIERGVYKNIPYKTRDVALWAKENGYDGVVFKNIKDNGPYGRTPMGDVYTFFKPMSQVKSADLVTYDDNGNIIPLSERFNTKNDDIRYSDRDGVREIQSAEYQNMVDHFGTTRNKTLADLGLAQYEGVKYSDRYDAKQRYVDRVMSKNAEVETLSDDQHWALRKVAEMRHKFHSNPDGLFNTESASYDMWNYVSQDGEINKLLEQAGLPTIEFGDYTYTPSTFDYEELGGKDEYETLEEWKEQSGVMDEFYKDFNDANERIEKYLRTIDEEHGTQYAPSGFSRLNSDRDPDATDNRTLLSNALESAAQNDNEKKLIERYKSKIDTINKEQKKLTDLRAKIKELSFAKGHRDVDQISKLQAEATNTANLISKLDKRLLKLEAAKPLKDVIDRERTLAKKKAEKAGKEALSAYREKAVQTQRELMNRYQERIKSGVENRRKHEFVNKIEKIAYDIQHRLEHPSAKTVIPEVFGKSVANFLKALDFTTFDNEGNVREGKANKTRAELRLSISNLADNLAKVSIEADYGQLDISADMLEWLKKMSTMLEEKYKAEETFYVRKMNSEELGDLYKLIKSLQTSINQASKFYTNMSSDVESLAYNTIIHLEPLYGKTHNTMLDSVDKLLRWDYAQPITVFDRFGDSGRTLIRMLMQGQKTMADNAEAIENFVQTAYTAEEVNKWREELHKITIQGKTYEVSTAFLMEFHNLLRDPDAKRHILEGGGIRFDDLVIGKKKTRFGDTYVTFEEAVAIDNVLTERQKQVAESLEKFMSETGAAWGNKISMRRFGYHAFGNIENYYPIKTIKAGSEYEARQKRANIYALLNKSFTKERNIHADNAIIVGDIFQTFNDHMSEMALYNAWALPVIDLIKWFNYRETQDVENKKSEVSVKEALRQAYGKNADEYIRRLLESINSQNSGGLSESIAFKNLRIVNRVAVSANLRVAIQQPFSITRAMELISPKYVKPLVGDAKNNAYNEMVANSSFGKWKSMGYYDVDVSRPLEVKVLKNASFADKFTEKSMFLAEAGDNFTWAVLWNACKAEVSEKNKGITNDELIAKTGERFDDIIIRTQVVDSVLTKSQWMRSDSFFHRMTSSFMSESMTSYNTLLRQYDRYSADAARTGKKSALKMNGKPIATTVTVFVLTQLINALATAPLDAARDDDDYKTFLEKMLEKFKRSALQNLLPTSMMPYIADIVEYAMYGNTDRPDLQLYTKAIDLGKQLKRTIDNYDYFKLHKLINSALSMASSISGIPMSNIARDAIAVWNTVVGNIGNGELKFQTSPDSSSVAYEKMYEAIVNGKTDKATKLYAQMQSNSVSADSINSALTSRVKQDYIDGKIDSDEASRLLKTIAEYTGKELTDDEIYWKIDKWNYEDENGTSDGYAKYDDFFSAVETGNDLRAVIQEYTENGVDKKTLASQITSHFKPIYVGMTRSERASIKGYLLNAYALLGYDRTEKSKDIDNWVK